MLEPSLVRLGLKDKEILVFLSLLELGPQPTSVIAKRTGLNRATAYMVLDSLVMKSLVSRVEKADIQTFAAISPEEILDIIRSRKHELEMQEAELKDVIPQLRGMMSQYLSRPKVRHYEGVGGVKSVMDETLTSNEPILTYTSIDAWEHSPLSDYMHEYCRKRSLQRTALRKCLAYDTPMARQHFALPHAFLDVHFISESTGFEWSNIDIFENKIVMVSLAPGNICGIIIEGRELASMQKSLFELAWKGCDDRELV